MSNGAYRKNRIATPATVISAPQNAHTEGNSRWTMISRGITSTGTAAMMVAAIPATDDLTALPKRKWRQSPRGHAAKNLPPTANDQNKTSSRR